MVKEIAFVAYPSKDVAGTRAWYEKHLGLRFAGAYAEDGVEQYNEAHVGNGWFSLMASDWVQRAPGSGAGVAFEVDNIEEVTEALRGAGIQVDEIYETPVCKIASLDDPEGNKITLHQITVPH